MRTLSAITLPSAARSRWCAASRWRKARRRTRSRRAERRTAAEQRRRTTCSRSGQSRGAAGEGAIPSSHGPKDPDAKSRCRFLLRRTIDHVVATFPVLSSARRWRPPIVPASGRRLVSSTERGATSRVNWSGQGCASSMALPRPRTPCSSSSPLPDGRRSWPSSSSDSARSRCSWPCEAAKTNQRLRCPPRCSRTSASATRGPLPRPEPRSQLFRPVRHCRA